MCSRLDSGRSSTEHASGHATPVGFCMEAGAVNKGNTTLWMTIQWFVETRSHSWGKLLERIPEWGTGP